MMRIKSRFIRHTTRNVVAFARRRPLTNVIIVAGGVLFALVGVGEALPGTSSKAAEPAASATVTDPADLFDARSPGTRHYGWLSQTKQPRTGFDVGPPSNERILPTGRRRPVVPTGVVTGSPDTSYVPVGNGFAAPPEGANSDIVTDTPSGVGFFGTPSGGAGPAIGGVSAGGGGSGGSGTGTTPGGGTPPVAAIPLPAVPEPGTWMMLLVGFFGIGTSLRRRGNRYNHGVC